MDAKQPFWKRCIPDLIWKFSDRYGKHNDGMMASSLAFVSLLSSFPAALLMVAIFGYILGSPDRAVKLANDFANSVMPGQNALVQETFVKVANSYHTAGLVAFFGLLIGGSALFAQIEAALNVVFETPNYRNLVHSRLLSFGWTLAALLFVGSSTITSVFKNLNTDVTLHFGTHHTIKPNLTFAAHLGATAVSLLLSFIFLVALYRLLPNLRVPWTAAVRGALAVTVGWEVARQLFGFYIARFAAYDKVYGAIAGMAITAVWMYYSMALLLIGAEIAAMYMHRPVTETEVPGKPNV